MTFIKSNFLIFSVTLALAAIIMLSCNSHMQSVSPDKASKQEFSLRGTTNGISNGTLLYMENTENRALLDSVSVENNAFYFKTAINKTPLQVVLRTKDYAHYRFLWLENNAMTFDGGNSDFRHANVLGSQPELLSQNLSNQIDTLSREEGQKIEMEFVKNNPKSIVSANVLSVYSTTWGKEKTVELFQKFSDENKNSEFGKKISKYIALNQDPQIGDQFVDFEMRDTEGNLQKLSEIKGKTILLEFWAAWCGPCRSENPNLVKTYNKFKSKGFEVFAVSLDDDKNAWLNAIEKDGLTWLHVSDLNGSSNEASLIYGINGIPDNFLIDENGVIIARKLRGEKLNAKLAEVLN